MPPVRTKQKNSDDGKKSKKHRSRREDGDKDANTLPGVQKIKASLRQTKRLLARDNLAPNVRVETERRLKALEADLEKAELAKKERHMAIRYHKVKFFERQKVIRKIQQIKKKISFGKEGDGASSKDESTLHELRVDLNYILHYPKTKKYISLFPPEVRKGLSIPGEAEIKSQQEEIRSWIRQRMEAGELPVAPEENAGAGHTPGKSRVDIKVPGKRSDVAKRPERRNTKPVDDIEQDDFFGDVDDRQSSPKAVSE
ncbi:hypothetical protein AMATHDRAFT_140881 [Amanita thiersii Skay4041]|uniref:rRNA-processing protein EFG1 n=1 Tax=Amanita thiersii Skay4041 TaxID=703135 RepID=A0A2A9NWT0_9AGAR|nr:hypothetical protein AMATHDRAFT_140881 [Amanita thiersii Skay4041]